MHNEECVNRVFHVYNEECVNRVFHVHNEECVNRVFHVYNEECVSRVFQDLPCTKIESVCGVNTKAMDEQRLICVIWCQ